MNTLTNTSIHKGATAPPRTQGRWLYPALIALVLALSQALPGTLSAHAQTGAVAAATVNINTADAATLSDRLTGVGLTRAQEIVRYRESYGPFSTVEELTDVKGIGPATVEKNRARIVLE
jgi:competence protein ComEA